MDHLGENRATAWMPGLGHAGDRASSEDRSTFLARSFSKDLYYSVFSDAACPQRHR